MVFSGLSPETIAAASRPNLVSGEETLADVLRRLSSFAVITMPEPWELVDPDVQRLAATVHFVEGMEHEQAERLVAAVPAVDYVVGLGGGTAVDAAKYVAWRRGLGLITAPSVISVDAAVTNTIAVREGRRVRYVGFVIPDRVVVDHALIRRAPARLNRAGVGDILSIHTALYDWTLAAAAGMSSVNDQAATHARELLETLYANAAGLRDVTPAAIDLLVRSYISNNAICLEAGTAQPEEGSEHFWAYHVEYLTGRQFTHGELVSLGVLLMSRLQDNQPARVEEFLRDVGVRYQPSEIGLRPEEFEASLLDFPSYVKAEGLWYTVADARPPDRQAVRRLAEGLTFQN